MNLEDIIEKIKRLEQGGNSTNIIYFIIAFDLLYFLHDNDNRERFIHDYYKNDNGMFTANFKRVCFYAESILIADEIYENMLKSIEMEVHRDDLVSMYNYYDMCERIEKANNSPKNMVSDSFKIRLLKNVFDSSSEEYQKLNSKVHELKGRYDKNMIDIVTIISIFIAISIGMVSGISFSLQAFSNLTENNLLSLSVITLVIGLVIFNLFYALFKFVAKLCGKDIDIKHYIIYINFIFVCLIAFFVLLSK